MLIDLKKTLQKTLGEVLAQGALDAQDWPSLELETPADKIFGEFSTNIALKSAKILRRAPQAIADALIPIFERAIQESLLKDKIARIEVKAPGFINFYLAPAVLQGVVQQVLAQKDQYGASDNGVVHKIQLEFVSANPTGPLSVAHARQAVVGDVLGNILSFLGFDVTKEYYVNDEGNQINILGRSLRLRTEELLGQTIDFPEEGYQGDYVKVMARKLMAQENITTPEALSALDDDVICRFGVAYLLDVIRQDLNDFAVHFDHWAYQSQVAPLARIDEVLKDLEARQVTYEKDGALWFRSTDFGDDKDRVLKKSDGSYTYLTPDIVYHKDKFDRGFDTIINIWGPDHHGYIPRIQAAAQALGHSDEAIRVLIVQLATLYRQGQPLSMSTRRGEFISLREVIDEVGVDAARFFFLMRHIKVHLDFDLELAKKSTSENPVYYIQYAYARVHSINQKAQDVGITVNESGDVSLLTDEEELDLMKKMGDFSEALLMCYQQWDPYALIHYLQELATCFHKFYDRHRVVDQDVARSAQRLTLVNAARIVLANGLRLLGVQAPDQM